MITEVARRYAKALLHLTKQKGAHLRAMEELRAIRIVFEKDEQIFNYFHNPLVTPDQKLAVIKKSFEGKGLSEDVFHLLTLLAERNRIGQIENVVDAFQEGIDAEEGITRGVVRAAKPLASETMKELETKMSLALKKKIILTFKEDPKLLGGVVAQAGGWIFDDSIETHLKNLNEDLNRSAN